MRMSPNFLFIKSNLWYLPRVGVDRNNSHLSGLISVWSSIFFLMNLGALQLFLKSRKVNRSLEHLTSVQVRCFCLLFIFAAVSNVFLSQTSEINVIAGS